MLPISNTKVLRKKGVLRENELYSARFSHFLLLVFVCELLKTREPCFGQGKTEAFPELPAKVLIINCDIQIEVKISTVKMIKLRSTLGFLEILSVLCISLAAAAAYTPVDNYLISCGSSVDTPVGQRLFVADDSGTVVLTSPASDAVKASPSAVSGLRDADAAMYQSARVFTAPSSYSFRIRDPGRHFVRLHFFPFVYLGYDLATASFKVSTQDAVLLDGFAPAAARGNALTTPTTPAAVCEEFLLDVARDTLVLTFVPLAGRLAFVNAIEVVSVPDNLIGAADSSPSTSDATSQQLNPAVMPLQTVYRVNVGGLAVAADSDTLWREWTIEQPFLVATVTTAMTRKVDYNRTLNFMPGQATADDAPAIVYATGRELIMNGSVFDGMKQMTWQFDVDGLASYLIRFHFCDIVSRVPGLLHMNAYVDSYQAIQDLDLSAIGNGTLAFPYYMDFVLAVSSPSGKLAVYVGSTTSQKITTPAAILNGLEIMRILTTAGSVVVVEPTAPPGTKKKNLAVVLGSVCGAFAFVSIAAALVIVLRRKEEKEELRTPTTSQPSTAWMPLLGRISFRSAPPSAIGSRSPSFTIGTNTNTPGGGATPPSMAAASSSPSYRFPFASLQDATSNFDEGLVIGEGGFGKVYAAVLQDGTKVAVKRANPESRQGAREFRTEIEMLSGLRHRHLVSLIGYCDEREEMILLYEYMEHGSLRSRLYGGAAATATALSWAQRLEACAGAARGLLYLHTATTKPVIHRDVKSSNILLDDGLTAKVADFGLSKAGPDMDETHVSTAVKGSFGYVDPEYVRTRKLTAKSDVYSFGVVLLEALCARPVVDPRLPKPMVNLVEWGLHWQRRDELEKIVDRRIAGTVRPASLRKYGETVARCLADRGADRPAMEDVVWSLQFVTRLQEVDGLDVSDVSSLNMVHQLMPPPSHARQRSHGESETGRTDAEDSSVVDDDYTDASMRGIFWQMVNVRGR
uniref:Protein kinase domain-containing protein n=1 Tax=Oryza punctata TaxID=4537 RepID=A0A0E0JE86_ORYPU